MFKEKKEIFSFFSEFKLSPAIPDWTKLRLNDAPLPFEVRSVSDSGFNSLSVERLKKTHLRHYGLLNNFSSSVYKNLNIKLDLHGISTGQFLLKDFSALSVDDHVVVLCKIENIGHFYLFFDSLFVKSFAHAVMGTYEEIVHPVECSSVDFMLLEKGLSFFKQDFVNIWDNRFDVNALTFEVQQDKIIQNDGISGLESQIMITNELAFSANNVAEFRLLYSAELLNRLYQITAAKKEFIQRVFLSDQTLTQLKMEYTAVFWNFDISMQAFKSLRAGDIITLNKPLTALSCISFGSGVTLPAQLGIIGNSLGMQVLDSEHHVSFSFDLVGDEDQGLGIVSHLVDHENMSSLENSDKISESGVNDDNKWSNHVLDNHFDEAELLSDDNNSLELESNEGRQEFKIMSEKTSVTLELESNEGSQESDNVNLQEPDLNLSHEVDQNFDDDVSLLRSDVMIDDALSTDFEEVSSTEDVDEDKVVESNLNEIERAEFSRDLDDTFDEIDEKRNTDFNHEKEESMADDLQSPDLLHDMNIDVQESSQEFETVETQIDSTANEETEVQEVEPKDLTLPQQSENQSDDDLFLDDFLDDSLDEVNVDSTEIGDNSLKSEDVESRGTNLPPVIPEDTIDGAEENELDEIFDAFDDEDPLYQSDSINELSEGGQAVDITMESVSLNNNEINSDFDDDDFDWDDFDDILDEEEPLSGDKS